MYWNKKISHVYNTFIFAKTLYRLVARRIGKTFGTKMDFFKSIYFVFIIQVKYIFWRKTQQKFKKTFNNFCQYGFLFYSFKIILINQCQAAKLELDEATINGMYDFNENTIDTGSCGHVKLGKYINTHIENYFFLNLHQL